VQHNKQTVNNTDIYKRNLSEHYVSYSSRYTEGREAVKGIARPWNCFPQCKRMTCWSHLIEQRRFDLLSNLSRLNEDGHSAGLLPPHQGCLCKYSRQWHFHLPMALAMLHQPCPVPTKSLGLFFVSKYSCWDFFQNKWTVTPCGLVRVICLSAERTASIFTVTRPTVY